MKVQRSAWDFAPRRLAASGEAARIGEPNPDPSEIKRRQLEELRAEHPWLSRGVEVLQMGAWIANEQSVLPPFQQASAALSGVTAAASAAWGVNKLVRGQTPLDRIEGVGSLALGVDCAASALQAVRPDLAWAGTLASPAGYVAAGCELLLGGSDLVRGLREDDGPRTWSGAAQLVSGASLAASLAIPGASGLAQAVCLMSMVARQSIYGIEEAPLPHPAK